MYIISDF